MKELKLAAVFMCIYAYTISAQNQTRSINYYPDSNDFVCINGNNRYTRALYGNKSLFRIETSDRPVFAAYNKTNNKNIRFRLSVNGTLTALDSVDHCESRYSAGKRSYILTDKHWGNGKLYISVLVCNKKDGGIWQFKTKDFSSKVKLEGRICEIANNRLKRNGDMGVEIPGSMEAPINPKNIKRIVWDTDNDISFVNLDNQDIKAVTKNDSQYSTIALSFAQDDKLRQEKTDIIHFHTPDAYINTLGSALVAAADGIWDGQTWLHGAIGWRMTLPGWRAGFTGDVLGMNDRAISHFNAYAASQVTNVPATIPHPTQDSTNALSRGVYKWGTPMYSNGYICRNPYNNHQFHHYDMNLNYIDELLWHFCYDADTTYMRKIWPVITRHLEWEKRNWDPDNNGLYDAYCCIWASDALYYNSGAATHSSAYNYRGNLLAAKIASLIGEDPKPYQDEANKILAAMNKNLWIKDKGHWAEYKDFMGLKRLHESAALWSIYTPIDCNACTPEQAYNATRYIDNEIPHIPILINNNDSVPPIEKRLSTVSTTNWMPYDWSINNVAQAEVMHTALAYFEAGRPEEGFNLMKSCVIDGMYLGKSPANFGQISYYDAALGECYRDFGDDIGISSRTIIQGLFGIRPNALYGECIFQPGFPSRWDNVSFSSPYMEYTFMRKDSTDTYNIKQSFHQTLALDMRIHLPYNKVKNVIVNGNRVNWNIKKLSDNDAYVQFKTIADKNLTIEIKWCGDTIIYKTNNKSAKSTNSKDTLAYNSKNCKTININKYFNSNVTDIFKNKYTSPSSPYTTLRIPENGIGQWCHPIFNPEINDSVFRSMVKDGVFKAAGIPFRTPVKGMNIIYTSLWNNYPDSIFIPLKGKASNAILLMAGSTNPMQSRIANGRITIEYTDGTREYTELVNPDNWCPIEQDYYIDGKAFNAAEPRPYRVGFKSGITSRHLSDVLGIRGTVKSDVTNQGVPTKDTDIKSAYREIPGGAGEILEIKLNPQKALKSITLRTLSNDVVIGLMSITLIK